jgi:2-polyprenyl-6-methoxyphenol hydroxylase-like FAD-dependent oxidoreductase
MRTGFDAVIIGAGPAGSSAAILLARAGWAVAVVERQAFPRRKVCGECVAASNLPLLEALGIGPAFEASAGPELRQVALMRGSHRIVASLPAAAHEKYPWGRALGRETLDTLLLEQARSAGAHVLQPWSVQGVSGEPGNWHCAIRAMDSQTALTLHTPVVIAANGSWEALPSGRARRQLKRRASDLFAFKATFRNASLEAGCLPVLSLDGGYGGMVVAGGGVTTVACCIRRDRLAACRRAQPGLQAGEAIEVWLKSQCDGARNVLRSASREGAWLAAGPLEPGIRLRASDTIFRIGNAGGEAHPIIGEGMSMALQSAFLLCAHLMAREWRGQPLGVAWQREIGARYALDWRRQFGLRLKVAAAFAHLAMRPVLARPLVALLEAWPGLLTLGAEWSGKSRQVENPFPVARLVSVTGEVTAANEGNDPAQALRRAPFSIVKQEKT